MPEIIVQYYWEKPDVRPIYVKAEPERIPFLKQKILILPEYGQNVSLELPIPKNCQIQPARTIVHGIVKDVKQLDENNYGITLERYLRSGLAWNEVGAHLNVVIIGYHPIIGRVKGKVIEISTEMELVNVELENADLTVWVSWTSLCSQGHEQVYQLTRHMKAGKLIPKLV